MKTFMQWLGELHDADAIFRRRFPDYEHWQCERCGRTLDKNWVEEFGPVCPCGGKLHQVSPEAMKDAPPYYAILGAQQAAKARGSA